MAEPIVAHPQPTDPRERLYRQLQKAPIEHAEAMLDAYAILQLLRDNGLLEIMKGVLGSGEKVLTIVTETVDSDEAITLFRNSVTLIKIIGGLNPAMLEDVQKALLSSAEAIKSKPKPPGFFHLLRKFLSYECRAFLYVIATVTESVGKHLRKGSAESSALLGLNRKKTTRHSA